MAAPHPKAKILSAATLCFVRIWVDRELFSFLLTRSDQAEDLFESCWTVTAGARRRSLGILPGSSGFTHSSIGCPEHVFPVCSGPSYCFYSVGESN